jgi:hypothetical protein
LSTPPIVDIGGAQLWLGSVRCKTTNSCRRQKHSATNRAFGFDNPTIDRAGDRRKPRR